jgi:hypothetical protein
MATIPPLQVGGKKSDDEPSFEDGSISYKLLAYLFWVALGLIFLGIGLIGYPIATILYGVGLVLLGILGHLDKKYNWRCKLFTLPFFKEIYNDGSYFNRSPDDDSCNPITSDFLKKHGNKNSNNNPSQPKENPKSHSTPPRGKS